MKFLKVVWIFSILFSVFICLLSLDTTRYKIVKKGRIEVFIPGMYCLSIEDKYLKKVTDQADKECKQGGGTSDDYRQYIDIRGFRNLGFLSRGIYEIDGLDSKYTYFYSNNSEIWFYSNLISFFYVWISIILIFNNKLL